MAVQQQAWDGLRGVIWGQPAEGTRKHLHDHSEYSDSFFSPYQTGGEAPIVTPVSDVLLWALNEQHYSLFPFLTSILFANADCPENSSADKQVWEKREIQMSSS